MDDKFDFGRDCPDYKYVPTILPKAKRIIVIGDIHGDFKYLIKCLVISKLISKNNKYNWIGGDTILVQIGDQIDSCRPRYDVNCNNLSLIEKELDKPYDMKIMIYLKKLNKHALKKGGCVISLIGNHELMNVVGDFRYVSYNNMNDINNINKYYDEDVKKKLSGSNPISKQEARYQMFRPGSKFAKLLGCGYLSCVIIGSFLFVHAGIVPDFLELFNISNKGELVKINTLIRKWLLGLMENNEYVKRLISGTHHSLFWDRMLGKIIPNINYNLQNQGINENFIDIEGYIGNGIFVGGRATDNIFHDSSYEYNNPKMKMYNHSVAECKEYVDKTLEILKIGHIVIGHTPQFMNNGNGINKTCNDKLFRVDVGGSDIAFGPKTGLYEKYREAQVLEILNDGEQFNIIR